MIDVVPCYGCKHHKYVKIPFSTKKLGGCAHVSVGPVKYMLLFSRGGDCEHQGAL